ncbi:MAG: glycosyltransferase family 1 protein [Dorea sp.]|jgi:glycosyltransferase involved in cell wall biosynthesis|nr:glycosyltransferase family 1 protein [Dorea sp.]
MIKILHMTPPDVNNGVYHYIFNHMEYIDHTRFHFAFLTKGAEDLRLTPEYKKYGFDVYELKSVQREDAGKFRQEITQILKQGFDIVHLHTSSWRGFMIEEIAMELGIQRVIVHSHSGGIDECGDKKRKDRIQVHELFKKQFSMKYATDVWACSELAASWLYGEGVPRDKIQIMPNAIDTNRYRYNPAKRERLRKQMGLENKIVVGNIGRYAFQKNHEFLIKVFAEAFNIDHRLYLLCLGEGELSGELKQMIDALGISDYVSLMDWRENVEDYLQTMDIFCLPSKFEGLPLSVIEAQAAGLNCLVADTVTKEVKLTDLVTFLPLEKEEWVRALLDWNPWYRREMWNEEVACAGYEIRSAAEKLEEMYEGAEE